MTRIITTLALIVGIAVSCLALPGAGCATAAAPTARVAAKKVVVVKKKKKHHRKHHRKHKKQAVSIR